MFSEVEGLQLQRRIAQLEDQVANLYRHLGIPFSSEPITEDDPQLIELIKIGKKMDAISLYRQRKAVSLAEAKQAVEEIQRKLGL